MEKVLFKMKCIYVDDGNINRYTKGKIYDFVEDRGITDDTGTQIFEDAKSVDDVNKNYSSSIWELVEKTLLDKFYDLLGVEDMEEFYISDGSCTEKNKFRFRFGILQKNLIEDNWGETGSHYIGYLLKNQLQIIKLPPKPQFTDEEKEQIKAIHLLFGECWVGKDRNKNISIFKEKPIRDTTYWRHNTYITDIESELLQFIKWEDTEPFHVKEGCWL